MYKINILLFLTVAFAACSGTNSEKINVPDAIAGNKKFEGYYTYIYNNMPGLLHISKNSQAQLDKGSIDDEFIVNNIKMAHLSAEAFINQGIISEKTFKEFVLPYRLNDAPIHDWRSFIWKVQHRNKIDNVNSIAALIDSCNAINDRLKVGFKFNLNNTYEDTLTAQKIVANKSGSCITMANYAAYTLRALGVPVAVDFTPAWGNMSGGHVWNALITSDSTSIPFLGAESNIGGYELFYLMKVGKDPKKSTYKLPGKVYRNTFSVHKESVYYRYDNQSDFLPMPVGSRMVDVTDQYFPVANIELTSSEIQGKPKLLYICNYNNGKFVPVMAIEKEEKSVFSKMVKNVIYYISTYKEKKENTNNFPVYLSETGEITKLYPNLSKRQTIKLDRTQSLEADQVDVLKKGWNVEECTRIAYGKINSPPAPNKEYRLYYWDKKWTLLTKKRADMDGILAFENVPSETMYLLCEKEPSEKERPFIIYKNTIKWV